VLRNRERVPFKLSQFRIVSDNKIFYEFLLFQGVRGVSGKDGDDGKDGVNGRDGRDGESCITDRVDTVSVFYSTSIHLVW